jgi:hypothetical protein
MVPRPGAAERDVELPLPLEGPGSLAELTRLIKRLDGAADDTATRTKLETLYRLAFTVDRGKRDHGRAAALAHGLAKSPTTEAAAERVRGFLAVSGGFDTVAARRHYERAIALDPEFGEAHYALAFLCALGDRKAGREHYELALRSGVKDTMSLARIYAGDSEPGNPEH